jgi:hypothetical protein
MRAFAARFDNKWSAVFVICLTIVVSSAVTATAGSLITGKQVKNSSLTGKDVKNSSLTGTDVKNESIGPSDLSDAAKTSGPQGPAGAPGAVRAYGTVAASVGSTSLVDGSTKGVLSVSRSQGTGQYCVKLDPAAGIDAAHVTPVATYSGPHSGILNGTVAVFNAPNTCAADEVRFRTYTSGGADSNEVGFNFLIP